MLNPERSVIAEEKLCDIHSDLPGGIILRDGLRMVLIHTRQLQKGRAAGRVHLTNISAVYGDKDRTVLLFPFIGKMEELLCKLIKDSPEDLEDQADSADFDLLEERLLSTPAIALSQSRRVIDGMSRKVRKNVGRALNLIHEFSQKKYEKVQRKEDLIDKYESRVGSYLMLLNPVNFFVNGYRNAFLYHRGFWVYKTELVIFLAEFVAVFFIGVYNYNRLRKKLPDVL